MTETLAEKKCTPCRGGVPPLTLAEAERFRSHTPNWELRDDSHRIERTFRLGREGGHFQRLTLLCAKRARAIWSTRTMPALPTAAPQ